MSKMAQNVLYVIVIVMVLGKIPRWLWVAASLTVPKTILFERTIIKQIICLKYCHFYGYIPYAWQQPNQLNSHTGHLIL